MKFIKKLVKKLSPSLENKVNHHLENIDNERKLLDDRLSKIVKVTLDGEEKWFLDLVKKKPECALKVLEECSNGNKK